MRRLIDDDVAIDEGIFVVMLAVSVIACVAGYQHWPTVSRMRTIAHRAARVVPGGCLGSFDDLDGAGEQRGRHRQEERLGR